MPSSPPIYTRIRPPEALRAGVRRIVLFREVTDGGLTRRELPNGFATLIVSFADPVAIATGGGDPRPSMAFAANADTGPVTAACGPNNTGLEIQMRPWFAASLLGDATFAMNKGLADLTPLFPGTWDTRPRRDAVRLNDRVERLIDWLRRRAATMVRVTRPEIVSAWALLEASTGRIPIADLASRSGWSHRHFKAVFEAETGLKPKRAARLLRFGRVCARLEAGEPPSLAELAFASGYSDQSHMTREFKAFAAMAPATLIERRLNDLPGFGAFEPPPIRRQFSSRRDRWKPVLSGKGPEGGLPT